MMMMMMCLFVYLSLQSTRRCCYILSLCFYGACSVFIQPLCRSLFVSINDDDDDDDDDDNDYDKGVYLFTGRVLVR